MAGVYKDATICWACRNACPDKDGERGCSWSRHFIPVDGWVADEAQLRISKSGRFDVSYTVRSCPQFEEG